MRQFASNLLTAKNIAFQFQPPTEGQDIKITSDLRRQVYLIFKESMHNVVRHSGCTEVRIVFEMESRQVSLKVTDNGKGLPEGEMEDGQGIPSMHRRATRIGGKLELLSGNDGGTTVWLSVPLVARSRKRVA
jgi:signal transduction histidine kinase